MRCSRFHWTGFPDARLLCYYNTNTAAVSAIIQTNLSKAKPLEERIYAQAFKTQDDLYSGHHENSYPPLFETYLSFYPQFVWKSNLSIHHPRHNSVVVAILHQLLC